MLSQTLSPDAVRWQPGWLTVIDVVGWFGQSAGPTGSTMTIPREQRLRGPECAPHHDYSFFLYFLSFLSISSVFSYFTLDKNCNLWDGIHWSKVQMQFEALTTIDGCFMMPPTGLFV
jgi:hypothetical protein